MDRSSFFLCISCLLVMCVISGYHIYQAHTVTELSLNKNNQFQYNEIENLGKSLSSCLKVLELDNSINCTNAQFDGIFEVRISKSVSNFTDFGAILRVELTEYSSARVLEKCVYG
jgi:hypothetical protein